MSKLVPILFAGSGAAVASVGGFYLLRQESNQSRSNEEGGGETNRSSQTDVQLTFEDVNAFTAQPTKSKCVSDYFKTVEINGQTKDINSTEKPNDGSEFFASPAVDDSSVNSCLEIEHKKTNYAESKGTGKFTGLGTFTTGSEGFISFNMAEPSTDSGKLKFTGIVYLVKKKTNENSTGEAKYRKSIIEDKKAGKDELDTYFPKPNSGLAGATQPYWGFIAGSGDLDNVCEGSNCSAAVTTPPAAPIKKELSWTKEDNKDKLLKDWAEKLDWGKNLYTDTHGALEAKIASFKGAGKEVTPSKG